MLALVEPGESGNFYNRAENFRIADIEINA